MDETDTVTDNRSRRIAKRQGTAAVMRECRIDRTLIIGFSLTLRDLRRRHYRETQEKCKFIKIKFPKSALSVLLPIDSAPLSKVSLGRKMVRPSRDLTDNFEQ